METKNEKLGNEPAFPSKNVARATGYPEGISKRFYAACMAMQGLMTNNDDPAYEYIAKSSFKMADELLKQEQL